MGSKKKGKPQRDKESKNKVDEVTSPPKTDEGDDSVSADTITTTESTKGKKSRGKRSVVALYKVVVKKALGKKFKVTYNETGNPNGRTRHTLQSYIGMLAQTMVPIDVVSWLEVDPELKGKLWIDVQDTFKVTPESKALVLTSAGTKWRQHIANKNLTRCALRWLIIYRLWCRTLTAKMILSTASFVLRQSLLMKLIVACSYVSRLSFCRFRVLFCELCWIMNLERKLMECPNF